MRRRAVWLAVGLALASPAAAGEVEPAGEQKAWLCAPSRPCTPISEEVARRLERHPHLKRYLYRGARPPRRVQTRAKGLRLQPRRIWKPRRLKPAVSVCKLLPGEKVSRPALAGWGIDFALEGLGMQLGRLQARMRAEEHGLAVELDGRLKGLLARWAGPDVQLDGRYPDTGAHNARVSMAWGRDDRRKRVEIELDARKKRAAARSVHDGKLRARSWRRAERIYDPVGLLLELRRRRLQVGDAFCAPVLVGDQLWVVQGRVERSGKRRTASGEHAGILLAGTARRPGARKALKVDCWLSSDTWRIPLALGLEGPFGRLGLSLERMARLR
ncbi:MAG: DUF3108 domain-containing protein [Deltaproteobacteria bacterium]|nr:DUF3108 domain-containing protein [Deltaproteobacteria bacterium]